MVVTLHKDGIVNLAGELILKGGANTVPAKKFAPWKKHPTVMKMVEQGVIEYTEDSDAKDEGEAQHLSALKVPEATSLVKATIDTELLAKWQSVEKRAGVKKAIEEQLKVLAEAPKMRDEGDDENKDDDQV